MLTKKQNRRNFVSVDLLSKLAVIPFEIDISTGEIRGQTSATKLFAWKILCIFSTLVSMFITVRLGQSLVDKQYFEFKHVSVHFLYSATSMLSNVFIYVTGIGWKSTIVTVWNALFTEGRNQVDQGSERRRLLQHSIQELYLLFLPFIMCWSALFVCFVVMLDSTRIQLMYSILDHKYQNLYTYLALACFELCFVGIMSSYVYLILFLQLSMFEACHKKLKDATTLLKKNRNEDLMSLLRQTVDSYRQVQLWIQLFNISNSYMIFAVKIWCLSVSIFGSFYAIRSFATQQDFLVTSSTVLYAFNTTMFFAVVYEKAFHITHAMNRLKIAILISSLTLVFTKPGHMKELRIAARSVSNTGIKVGSFHTLERISTPIFIGFITTNIAGLLITFRGK